MILWIIPFAFGFSLTQPSLGALLSKNVPKEKLGTYLGTNEGITALMRVIGPLIGTILFSVDMIFPFYVEVLVLILALFLSLILGNLVRIKNSSILLENSPPTVG
jgi:MFS family permease